MIRLREPAALHADEERRFRIASSHPEVVDEERFEGGMDRHDSLAATLEVEHPALAT
jgi:hypothetical protein